jgi:hypothetical protein
MDSILNIDVSCFANYESTVPKPVNLLRWLKSDKYKAEVEAIRNEKDKDERYKLKEMLPAITPSGIFTERNTRCLTQHSGFIAFDIDLKENTSIANYGELKSEISKIKNVAYAGSSVSGTGLWGLIPIAQPDKHQHHFKALENSFKKRGIVIDSKCKDVTRLRGYSYDPDGYFNHHAITFTAIVEPPKSIARRYKVTGTDDRATVESVLNKLTFDVTSDYGTWFEMGCALANAFGEDGRDYFHAVSRWHPNYSQQETDRQFTHCLKHNYNFKLGTFFYHLKNVGIEPDRQIQVEIPKKEPQHEFALDGTPIGEKGYPISWDLEQTPLQKMININPHVQTLIDRLGLIEINSLKKHDN